MTTADNMNCPVCGAKGCRAIKTQIPRRLPERMPVGPCAECGWCKHTTDMSDVTAATGLCAKCGRPAESGKKWNTIEHLPRPPKMPDDEFRFRATMFLAWLNEPAAALLRHFQVFADFLADRGSVEEVAARADWKAYANKKTDPKAWWQWTVPAGAGWIERERVSSGPRWENGEYLPGGSHYIINYDRAKLTRTFHNGRWFLCWPPGFVRITAPLHHDMTRWRMTIERERGLAGSRPIERVWPGGYTQLLCPYEADAPKLVVEEGGVVKQPRPEEEDLGLFREDDA